MRTTSSPTVSESSPAAEHAGLAPALCRHIGFVLAKAHQAVAERIDRVIADSGLQVRHFGLLILLDAQGPQRQIRLGELVRLDRTTVMHLVDDLERLGFASRQRDPSDRRANAVTITPSGHRWLEAIRPQVQAEAREFLSPLSNAEQALLHELLVRLVGPAAT